MPVKYYTIMYDSGWPRRRRRNVELIISLPDRFGEEKCDEIYEEIVGERLIKELIEAPKTKVVEGLRHGPAYWNVASVYYIDHDYTHNSWRVEVEAVDRKGRLMTWLQIKSYLLAEVDRVWELAPSGPRWKL